MNSVVIDASVTLGWLFDESDGLKRIGTIFSASELIAPWLWRLEVVNTILVNERSKRLSIASSARLFELLEGLQIKIMGEPATRNLKDLAAMARPHQLTSYDALYLELAMDLGVPLFTRDNNLRDAAKRVGVKLVKEA